MQILKSIGHILGLRKLQPSLSEKGGGRLMGKDAQEILLEKFNVKLSKNSVYALLHKIGLSWVSSRSRHPK